MSRTAVAIAFAAALALAGWNSATACSDEAWEIGFDSEEMTMEDLERLQRETPEKPVG
ncbi:MAG: hypothetical protein RJQ21_19760 [Rhodospirillales bacterium]